MRGITELYRGLAERPQWASLLDALQLATRSETNALLRFNLEFVIEEWFDNLCSHARQHARRPLNVRVCLRRLNGQTAGWRLMLIDDGQPFDPTRRPPPDLNAPLVERTTGGLGIYLSLQMADKARYRRHRSLNCLSLCLHPG